ncbi:GroES-like protein [Byssothecium circinans]|uniref:GroES-like protein n=1 Tax=Byssothecium circinans TaxID=147558 RepID=A0A6A5TLS8_9PLEO|nr:GroES-like protein [Byssothecium circinans]
MATAISSTMKAWAYSRAGPHRQVLSQTTIPTPKAPTGDQVMIKVAYSGLNYGDVKTMAMMPSIFRNNAVPAMDYSGTIIAVGPSVPSHLSVGTRVFGILETLAMFKGIGSLCEYMCISTSKSMVAPVPANFSLEDNGGIGENCGLRMLINGSSGGCGTAFVQPNFELVKSLGADRVLDYRESDPLHVRLAKEFGERPFDIVIDTVRAQELYTNSPSYLKEDGIFLNIGDFTNGLFATAWNWLMNWCWPRWLGGTPRNYVMFGPDINPETVEQLLKLMEKGEIKAVKERTAEFDDVLEAFDILASKRTRGRIVVKVAGS